MSKLPVIKNRPRYLAFGKDEQEGHEIECPEPNLEGLESTPHYCAYTDECSELGAPWCDALWGVA